MTYAEVLTEARRLARVSVQGLSDSDALAVVSSAIRKFCSDVGGFRYQRKLQVVGYFTPETFEGFHLKIEGSTNNNIDKDVAITDVGGDKTSGSDMATELQVQIRAAIGTGTEDLTVTWGNFKFVVDAIDSTSIEISSPEADVTYLDATEKYFGGVDTGTTSITGGFPRGCTVGSPLESNFRTIRSVTWNRFPLTETTEVSFLNPQSTGTPAYYYIENWDYILLYPVPTTQKDLTISYEGLPVLATTPATSTDLPAEIPTEFQDAIIYRVAEELLLGTHETELAGRMRFEYTEHVTRYRIQNHNKNTEARIGLQHPKLSFYVVGE